MSSEEVRCISTSIIQPSRHGSGETTVERIELMVWDLRLLQVLYMQRGLLFTNTRLNEQYKQEETNDMMSHLKTSLSHTLDHFFPLAGRLAIEEHDDGTISIYLNCNSAGVEFIQAAADITVADILDQTYVPCIVQSFFPLNRVLNYDGRFQPLLSIQVTQLIDGIFIGCSMNHAVCDGTSFWHFLNSWSEMSRGSDHISRPPILKRWFPENTDYPIRLPVFPSISEQSRKRHTPFPVEERVFHFKTETIAKLKARANSKSEVDHNISSLQALFAHVWISVTRARCLDLHEETSFLLVVGHRARLNPPLPKSYFGNSAQAAIATAKVGELLERGLTWGASLLNEVVTSRNDAAIRSSLDSWVKKPDFLYSGGSSFPKYSLAAGGSPRFNMYGNDFGWGRPVAVRTGLSSKHDGKITVCPGRVEGSIDIELCLFHETAKSIEHDVEFMDTVSMLPPFQSV